MPEQLLTLASILAAVVAAVVEVIKAMGLSSKWAPLAAVATGIVLGIAYVFGDIPLTMRLWAGGLAGLAASGFYSNLKAPIKEKKEE